MTYHEKASQNVVDQHAGRVSTRAVLRNERNPKGNVWYFESPKNKQRCIIEGDIPFQYAVLLEGDTSVASYQISPDPFPVQTGAGTILIDVDCRIQFVNKSVQWWDFKRLEGLSSAKRTAALNDSDKSFLAEQTDATYHIKTDVGFRGQEIAFDNWLSLCAAITRCRGHILVRERQVFSELLSGSDSVTLTTLFDTDGVDIAYMHAVVAIALQQGFVSTDLSTQLYGPHSILRRGSP